MEKSEIIQKYLESQEVKKLHVGCGRNIIDSWLNCDLSPYTKEVAKLDVTKPFPFEKNTFDFVLSEHMIEHIDYKHGSHMLQECYRVLKNDWKIRVSTPNFQFLMKLYTDRNKDIHNEYIRWTTKEFIPEAPYNSPMFVINNFVRDWGHKFIYDEFTLYNLLKANGFSNIKKCSLNESEENVFRNLENELRMPPGFLKLETFTLEATKVDFTK